MSTDHYPVGPAISNGARLIGAINSKPPTIYLHSDGKKYGITSEKVFNRYGFTWKNIRRLAEKELNLIPDGPVID